MRNNALNLKLTFGTHFQFNISTSNYCRKQCHLTFCLLIFSYKSFLLIFALPMVLKRKRYFNRFSLNLFSLNQLKSGIDLITVI